MKLSFKEWLDSPVKNKKRVVIYDFDATIAQVPERPANWKDGDWWGHDASLSEPHYDGAVNQEVVESFKKDQADPLTHVILLTGRRGIIAHKVRSVMRSQGLYGKRMIPDSNKKAKEKFQQNLNSGIDAVHPEEHLGHEEYYSGDHHTEPDYPKTDKGKIDGTTLIFKIHIIADKMMHPGIEIVEIWDDRADHFPHFVKMGQDLIAKYGVDNGGKLQKVIIHRVFPPAFKGGQATIKHIPIKPGMVY